MALDKDIKISYQQDNQIHLPVAAGATIHTGALVMLDKDQFARPAAANIQGGIIIGIAANRVEASTGSKLDDEYVRVDTPEAYNIAGFEGDPDSTDPLTEAARGRMAYVFDDYRVTLEPSSTAHVAVGVIKNVKANGLCAIRPIWALPTGRQQNVVVRLATLKGTSGIKGALVTPFATRLIGATLTVHGATDADLVVEIVRKSTLAVVTTATLAGPAAGGSTVVFSGFADNESPGAPGDGYLIRMAGTNANTLAIDGDMTLEYTAL